MSKFGWDLPPGCRVSDILGNRPEDMALEEAEEGLLEALNNASLYAEEYPLVADIGIAAIKKHRAILKAIFDERCGEEKMYKDWLVDTLLASGCPEAALEKTGLVEKGE